MAWKTSELAGCEVFEVSGERLGVLSDVLPTGSNDVWVVKGDRPGEPPELLVPALKTVVREVDTANRKITVALPPGLRDEPDKEQ